MNLSPNLKRKLRVCFKLITFGISAGLFFVMFADGFNGWYPFINGAIIGFLIAVIASIFELVIYENSVRKKPFISVLIIRSLFYMFFITIIFVGEIGIARMIKEDLSVAGLIQNEAFNEFLFGGRFTTAFFYTFAVVIIINFNRQISRKLGHKVFFSLVTGSNYQPKEQSRIFMFINIPNSGKIVDKIGRLEFHQIINEIVYDITLPILNNFGIIYQYVEGEMVISWKMKDGLNNANAVRCFFDIKDTIHSKKEKYFNTYGVTPDFKGALHCGKVIKGEIGFFKSEIVYHGDVMNTTSRILGVCNKITNELLISEQLFKLIKIPIIYSSDKCGSTKLKGKKEQLELISIKEMDSKSISFS